MNMSGKEGPRRSTRIRNHQFLESKSTTNHSFQLLPAEIRAEIFNKLTHPRAPRILRTICKQWAEDIKNDYNYTIKFKEDSPRDQLQHVLQLRIVNLEVKKIVKNRIPTFKYPALIRRLSIGHEMSPNVFKAFLQRCQTTLRDLTIKISPQLVSHQFPTPIAYDFANLKRLHLRLNFCHESPQKSNGTAGGSIFDHFIISSFPNLNDLKATFLEDCSCLVSPEIIERNNATATSFILKLLTKNPKRFERLTIEPTSDTTEQSTLLVAPNLPQLSQDDLQVLKSVRNLKLIDFDLELSKQIPANGAFLLDLISRQVSLEDFQLISCFPFHEDLLKSLTLKNHETLVSIRIYTLIVNNDRPFDLGIFKTCPRLKALLLERNNATPRGALIGSQLVNLCSLPDSLRSFDFRNFDILSEDLLVFLSSEILLQSLEVVNLLYCCHSGEFGVNLSVLEKVVDLECRSLEAFRMFVNWGTGEEAPKRREILDKLGRTEEPGPGSPGLSLFRNEFNQLRPIRGRI